MRVQQIQHVNCPSEALISHGRMDPALWEAFCRECGSLVPDGHPRLQPSPIPMLTWEGEGGQVRLVFFAVSDGTELLLEMDTPVGAGLIERIRPRYRRRLRAFLKGIRESYGEKPRRRRWWSYFSGEPLFRSS